jgi:hypothetical protein
VWWERAPVPDYAIVVGNPARIQGFRGQRESSQAFEPIPDEPPTQHVRVE